MAPFQSVGEKARWKILYDQLRLKNIGDIFTYAEMGALLELDPRLDRHLIQMAFRRAATEYLAKDTRAVDAVRGEGYEIVHPRDQLRLARRHGVKAGRQLDMAVNLSVFVDFEGMDLETRTAFEMVAGGFSHQQELNRRQDRTNRKLWEAQAAATVKVERTQSEVDELKRRLDDLHKLLNPDGESEG